MCITDDSPAVRILAARKPPGEEEEIQVLQEVSPPLTDLARLERRLPPPELMPELRVGDRVLLKLPDIANQPDRWTEAIIEPVRPISLPT